MREISSWWDVNPVRIDLDDYAPGGDLWPQAYDRNLEVSPMYDLSGPLGPGAKRVVINDYLAAGQMYVTEGEIILSKLGWDALLAHLDRQKYVREMVSRIVEREMGDVLTWLREAGHDL